ncbi:MAG: hypothetical protein CSYNP_01421 [Syntrophus sp. SKADARSKE-3]|nr:hypothetical protein [Syntrophus sp. SKADARSKE-3]
MYTCFSRSVRKAAVAIKQLPPPPRIVRCYGISKVILDKPFFPPVDHGDAVGEIAVMNLFVTDIFKGFL